MSKKVQVDKNIVSGILAGAVIALLLTVMLTLLLTVLVSSGRVGEERESDLVAVSALIAAAAGTAAARHRNKGYALIGGISVAMVNIILRLLLTLLEGKPLTGAFISISLATLVGGLVAGLIGARGRKRKKR